MASRSTKEIRYAQPAVKPKPVMNAVRSAMASAKPMQPQGAMTLKPLVRTIMTKKQPMQPMIGTDKNGNRLGPRPKVGEADAATRRRMLDEQLKPGPPVKPASAPKTPPAQQYEGGGMGNKARRKVIDQTVDKMS